MTTESFELVGLIPAAGHARRLASPAGSKELIPVPDHAETGLQRPVAAGLLNQMVGARCARVFFITRAEKADIAKAFGSGNHYHVPIGYVMIEESWGPPFTLAAAFKFAPGAGFAIGFPDIMIDPPDAMSQLASRLRSGNAEVVIATFPAQADQGVDLITSDENGVVTGIMPKEQNPSWPALGKTWLLAVWRPSFTEIFERTLEHFRKQMHHEQSEHPDLPTGKIFAQALQAGLVIESVHFEQGRFLDIGAPDRLAMATDFYQHQR